MNYDERLKKALSQANDSKTTSNKIGTLSEKTLHLVLKYFYEPNPFNHEVKLGSYVADIYDGNSIIEIQTRNFNLLRKKLSFFLTNCQVRVVYPIAKQKHLIWLDQKTGEISKKRKSPKVGSAYEIFYELYKIKSFLSFPLLKFSIVLLDITEYRNLDGYSLDKKKGSSRNEWIIERFVDEVTIDCVEDYLKLIPNDLPKQFSSKDYKEKAKLSIHKAQVALNVLKHLNVIKPVDKIKNTIIYEINI